MRYFDIVKFEPDKSLCSRLGYKNVYSVGKDIQVSERPLKYEVPQIVISNDQGILIGALRDGGVVGIIFKDNELNKKIIEKAAELRKTIFIPLTGIVGTGAAERKQNIQKVRKIIFAAHALKANARIISLAESKEYLLSTAQMLEIESLLKGKQGKSIFDGSRI